MPNLIFYNWACHAGYVWSWLCAYLKKEICVDSWACSPYSLLSLFTCDKKINSDVKCNPIIYNSIRVWHDLSRYLGRKDVKSSLSPIVQNPDFPAGTSSSVFSLWGDRGIHVIGDLFKDDIFLYFGQLQDIFDIPKQHFIGYLQIRHVVSSLTTSFSLNLPCNDAEKFILERQNSKHFISSFYSLLVSVGTYKLPNSSRKWGIDLGTEYIEDDWQASINLIRTTFICNRLRGNPV